MIRAGARLRPQRRRSAPDPAIATINIVFLLLLFFVMAGTVAAPEETRVDPAVAADRPGGRLPRPLITLSRTGEIYLDGRSLARSELTAAIADLSGSESDRPFKVYIFAAHDLAAETLVATIQTVAAASAAVSLVAINHDGQTR